MTKQEEILKIVSTRLRTILRNANLNYELLQEIRIRIYEPFIILYDGEEKFLNENGQSCQENDAYCVTQFDLKETLSYISSYSLYAYEEEIRQGFITVVGGHRVGLAGKTILENQQIKSIKSINFLNIRISHERKGCGSVVTPFLFEKNRVCHTLIISPPGCGKTTLLRDIIRLLSNGDEFHKGVTIGVVDERSEIGACFQGIPQNDVGIRTDILDCCPKAEGLLMLIRSMSPTVIAVDEIGKREDIDALAYVMNCGCKIIATVHGDSVEDIKTRPLLRKMIEERQFKRYIVLSGDECPGKVDKIFDEHGTVLLDSKKCCGV